MAKRLLFKKMPTSTSRPIIDSYKNMALLFFGLHYYENYLHFTNLNHTIDFRLYVDNIKSKLIDYFKTKFEIDTFICTNDSKIKNELIEAYQPKDIFFSNEISKNVKIIKVFQMMFEYMKKMKKGYEYVILTRLDIYFMKDFLNIDFTKLNLVSILENNNYCDDNFYLIPKKYIPLFYTTLLLTIRNSPENRGILHTLKNVFERIMPVHYLCNENRSVNKLSFFKLRYLLNIAPI